MWDLYDEHRQLTGETVPRETVKRQGLPAGRYHLVVHVCIFNSAGLMLIQQRQPFKSGWPNLWDVSLGGSAMAGDNSRQAAMRELQEELGLTVDLTSVHPHFSVQAQRCFDDFYLLEMDVDLSTLRLQPEEVQAVRWASLEEIQAMIEQGTFIPYHPGLIQFLFESRKQYGVHSHPDPTKV